MILKEIAQELKVSRRTVSRVISNDIHVDSETRKLIENYIKNINYVPNHMATNLAKSKANVIGLVIPRGVLIENDNYFSQILINVNDILAKSKHHLMLVMLDEGKCEELIRLYKSKVVGAFMVFGMNSTDMQCLETLRNNKIPFLTLFSHFKDITSLDCDNVKGGYLAGKYLIESGRKTIAFLHGHPSWVDSADRYEGFIKALAEKGIQYNQEFTRNGWFSFDKAKQEVLELLKTSKQTPDAIFAANDKMAMGAISAIYELGRKVPDDIAVIGYDNISESELYNPTVTTIEQPIGAIAKDAAEKILDIVNGNQELAGQNTFYEPRLTIRKSA